jgi:hypothetical protein
MGEVLSLEEYRPPVRSNAGNRAGGYRNVFFTRDELDQILQLYSRMVMQGEWHDYAMAPGPDAATFAIFRRASASSGATYKIIKQPKLAQKQGAFSLIGAGGRTLKRGHTLTALLSGLNRKALKSIS